MSDDPFDGLPHSLRIGPFDVPVSVEAKVKGGRSWGCFDSDEMYISLAEDMPHSPKVAEVLVHEIFHAIFSFAGGIDGDDEERIVETLAIWLIAVFRSNPKLREWFYKAVA